MPAASSANVDEVAFDADEIDRAILGWQVEEAMRRLTHDHQVVLAEVHLRGRPIADVAAALGVPAGTVKSRVYYALRALRVALDELGWGDAAGGDRTTEDRR